MALHLLLIRWQTIEKVVTDPISKETTENCLLILKVFELRAFMKLTSYPLWFPGPSAPLVMGSLCPHPPSPAPLGRPESVRPSPTYLTHPSPLLKLIFATNCSSLVLHCLDCHCYTSFPIGAPIRGVTCLLIASCLAGKIANFCSISLADLFPAKSANLLYC